MRKTPAISSTAKVRWQPGSAALAAVAIFLIDALTPLDIAVAVLYGLVVMICSQFCTRRQLYVVAAVCIALTLIALEISRTRFHAIDALGRCLVSLTAITLTTFLSLKNQHTTKVLREQAGLLELTQDAIFVHDLHGQIRSWNRGAAQLYGWRSADAIGANAHRLLQSQFNDSPEQAMATVLRDGRWEGELKQRRQDGSALVVCSRWSLWRDERGQPLAVLQSNTDITVRKCAEARAQQQERELRDVIDTIPAMLWNSTPDGNLASINRRWTDLGLSLEDVHGDRWRNIVHPDDQPQMEQDIAHAMRTRGMYETVSRWRRADGQYRWMLIRGLPLLDASGEVIRWYGVMNDIEELRRAEDALQRSQSELAHANRVATLGELTASIAHEVNQPLAALVTNGEASLRWLSRPEPQLQEVRDGLKRMICEGRRASEVVRNLRELARKGETQRSELDPVELIDDAVLLVQREATRLQINLRRHYTQPLPRLLGDRVQLQQVVINLLVNALQAIDSITGGARQIVIQARTEGDGKLYVGIVDSGPGITANDLDRLFTAFFSTKAQGMGMGLSICRTIIQAHGGRIWASSEPGQGSVFQFVLPPLAAR
ncbi:MAG: PAS domain S-box protein [Dyella sp.]